MRRTGRSLCINLGNLRPLPAGSAAHNICARVHMAFESCPINPPPFTITFTHGYIWHTDSKAQAGKPLRPFQKDVLRRSLLKKLPNVTFFCNAPPVSARCIVCGLAFGLDIWAYIYTSRAFIFLDLTFIERICMHFQVQIFCCFLYKYVRCNGSDSHFPA
jgi:hypothetical protein